MRRFIITFIITGLIAGILPYFDQPAFSQSKTELQQELSLIEQQIAEYERELANTQAEKQTLSTKLKQLQGEQKKIQLQINATNIKMDQLDDDLGKTEDSIRIAGAEIDVLKNQTAELIRSLYISDQITMVEILISADSLPEALQEVASLQQLSDKVIEQATRMKNIKLDLEDKQTLLEAQQDEAKNLLALKSLQEQEYQGKVSEQAQILEVTKGIESQYQAVLSESRKKANEIRARLYELAGGSTTQVTFGQAVEIAKLVSAQTGVRAAFLLAILTQESSLGKNVGTCNRVGDPPEKHWTKVMHPTRDLPKFEQIVTELGMDPEGTPVSCPMTRNGRRVGWGGAMGPAQFIPSTWVGYKDKVAAITGRPANPWDIRDAFLAAGLLLKSRGATEEGRTGEWKAAMRYFSGGTNPAYRFYGDNVLKTADKYQAEMDALAGQ